MASPASPEPPVSPFSSEFGGAYSLHQRPFAGPLQRRLGSFSKGVAGEENTPYSLRVFRSFSFSPREEKEAKLERTEPKAVGGYEFHTKLFDFYAAPRVEVEKRKAEGGYEFHTKLSDFYSSPRVEVVKEKFEGGYDFLDRLSKFYGAESSRKESPEGGYHFHDRLSKFYSVESAPQARQEGGYDFLKKLASIYTTPASSSTQPEGGYEFLKKLSNVYAMPSSSSKHPEGGYDFLTKLSDFYGSGDSSSQQREGGYEFLTKLSGFYGTGNSSFQQPEGGYEFLTKLSDFYENNVKSPPLTILSYNSSSLPFGQDVELASIKGQTYSTSQVLVQQVAYALSDKIFAYSPESFDLDLALKHWIGKQEKNAFGFVPGVQSMETRAGAGALALGYMFSRDFDLEKRNIPQTVIASTASLAYMRLSLEQLSLLHALANPFVAHVAAVDYSSSGLVTDYTSALSIVDELGLGLVASASANETQHMSLFATLLAKLLPAIHIYDGVTASRQTAPLSSVLDQGKLQSVYDTVTRSLSRDSVTKYTTNEGRLVKLLAAFNKELGTDYRLFEYAGHSSPENVLVVFGSIEASVSRNIVEHLAKNGEKLGVINVRAYRPFVEEEFLKSLPESVKRIGVLGQVENDLVTADKNQHSALYQDVLAALTFLWGRKIAVKDLKYSRSEVWTESKILAQFETLADKTISIDEAAEGPDVKYYRLWDTEGSSSSSAALALGQILSSGLLPRHFSTSTGHDNLVQGGAIRTDLRASDSPSTPPPVPGLADFAIVGDEKLLAEFDVLTTLKEGGSLLLKLPGAKNEDLEKKISVGLRQGIASKGVKLFILDPSASERVAEDPTLESLLTQIAFLHLNGLDLSSQTIEIIAKVNGNAQTIQALVEELDIALRQFDVPESWATVDHEVEKVTLQKDIAINSFSRFERVDPEPPTELSNWIAAAKGLVFKEAYSTRTALRPDVGIKTSVVHVKEHRRLTPLTYGRNIFHIEFDLGDSGLTYNIGEALGIHAENDASEVTEFITWYGLDPSAIVSVPSREDSDVLESRTVYQSLMQNIDIFGRPPKRFYEALSSFATNAEEKKNLLALGGPEGATEFKRRAEVDTITFADVLQEFPSAHPSFHDLVRIVSPMKRREYSIASSQHAQPNSVSLLIVTLGWVDPRGRDRFGQATRYLNALPIGAPVTVSVKPSVMKLPPTTTAPIIMAGLGTGLAPFRAFVQERAYQRDILKQEIGAVMLYLGSRHQREEYLYGEEWEAYLDAGVMTHLGAAFSRDQNYKIYIQDRMRQSMDELREIYLRQEGAFYLCGPTWPVPDVTEVLQEVVEVEEMSKGKEKKKIDSRRAIEILKEEGRYVLEVY